MYFAISNTVFQLPKFRVTTILLGLLFVSSFSFSQEKKRVEILNSGYGESVTQMGANVQRLVDSVYIRHKEILMWCDTAYLYSGTNKVNAIGHVHIKQGDTLDLYANNILYNGDISFARAWNNVVLRNKTTRLYSDTIDYDLDNNISYYNHYGKIVDSTTTLTSKIGKYYMNENYIDFFIDVKGDNEKFTLENDTLKYNTVTGKMFIEGPTTIRDSANTLYAEAGWYDSKTGKTELKRKAIIYNEKQRLKANYIKYDKLSGKGKALGSVSIEDTKNHSIILGNIATFNKLTKKAMVTDSAVYMSYTSADTLFLHADTLRTAPDTIEGEKIVSAYYSVRFYRTDLQGVCDSMIYFTKDSVIQLYKQPVIWSENHQLSAELIEMKQQTDGPDELHLTKKSFIISQQDTGQFDQIKGKEMVGYIINRQLTRIDVNGNGETLYYAREKEEIIGLNRAESSKISIRFKEGKIHKIHFIKAPEGELKPLTDLTEADKKLSDFDWKIQMRPHSKEDIFTHPNILPLKKRNEKKKTNRIF
jgi:lipopolysaccharide export system protein LptA